MIRKESGAVAFYTLLRQRITDPITVYLLLELWRGNALCVFAAGSIFDIFTVHTILRWTVLPTWHMPGNCLHHPTNGISIKHIMSIKKRGYSTYSLHDVWRCLGLSRFDKGMRGVFATNENVTIILGGQEISSWIADLLRHWQQRHGGNFCE